jgi:hypothetical protein
MVDIKVKDRKAKAAKSKANLDEGLENHKFFGFDVQELRNHAAAAVLGYLRMNVINPPDGAVWGTFNNRPVDQAWVRHLINAFETNLDSCTDDVAMDIALDPKWLANPTSFRSTLNKCKSIDELNIMEFSEEGEKAVKEKQMWVLGGNHRRLALKAYIDNLKATLAQYEDAIGQESKENATEADSDEEPEAVDVPVADSGLQERLSKGKRRVEELEKQIKSSSMWAMRVYDRGAWSVPGPK